MINSMKFRARETTENCCIVMKPTGGLSAQELHHAALRSGLLALEYHFVVQKNGEIETGREESSVAGHTLANPDVSLYILVDTEGKLTDAQKVALRQLKETIKQQYPSIKMR